MPSAFRTTLLTSAAALLALGAAGTAQAGGLRHDHFNSFLLGGFKDDAATQDADLVSGAADLIDAADAVDAMDTMTDTLTDAAEAAHDLIEDAADGD